MRATGLLLGLMRSDTKTRQRIRDLRKSRGLSQHQVAVLAGLHPAALCHIERGHRPLWPGHLAKVAKALRVSVEELRGEAEAANG